MTTFDPRPFHTARRDFRDIVSIPVMTWLQFNQARRTVPAYRNLVDAPMELSAAGCSVTTTTNGAGWCIAVEKEIAPGAALHLSAEARSYAHCLFQLANTADQAISDLEHASRRQWDEVNEAA